MRLLHPETLQIVAEELNDDDFKNATVTRKTVISHAWAEVFKYLSTRQTHPKMFLSDGHLGYYMKLVYLYGTNIGCNFDESKLVKFDDVWYNYLKYDCLATLEHSLEDEFDSCYLFSDAVSLYFKGLNIVPYIFGEDWRRYVPIENLKEIYRVVGKTLGRNSDMYE